MKIKGENCAKSIFEVNESTKSDKFLELMYKVLKEGTSVKLNPKSQESLTYGSGDTVEVVRFTVDGLKRPVDISWSELYKMRTKDNLSILDGCKSGNDIKGVDERLVDSHNEMCPIKITKVDFNKVGDYFDQPLRRLSDFESWNSYKADCLQDDGKVDFAKLKAKKEESLKKGLKASDGTRNAPKSESEITPEYMPCCSFIVELVRE